MAKFILKKPGAGSPSALETLGIDVARFTGFVSGDSNFHGHDIVELAMIVGGQGRQLLGGDAYDARRGSLRIVHYHQEHGFDAEPPGLDILNVYLDLEKYPLPALPESLRNILPSVLPLHSKFGHALNKLVHIQFDPPDRPIQLLLNLQAELQARRPGFAEAVDMYFTLFLIDCCRQFGRDRISPRASRIPLTAEGNPRIEAVRGYLDRHFRQPISLDDLSARFGYQKNYLCRVFKAYASQTIVTYLRHRRIERSMVLLRTTREKVLSVAYDSGFADLSHFNRTFRKITGLSPRQFRVKWRAVGRNV